MRYTAVSSLLLYDHVVTLENKVIPLGAEVVLSSRQIESFLRVFKQFTHALPSRQVVSYLSICPPL